MHIHESRTLDNAYARTVEGCQHKHGRCIRNKRVKLKAIGMTSVYGLDIRIFYALSQSP
jgi:hypothetical protein